QTVFHIEDYSKGYFWGKTAVRFVPIGDSPRAGGLSAPVLCFQLVGSVTPEGSLYLSFSSSSSPAGQGSSTGSPFPTPSTAASNSGGNSTVGIGVMRFKAGEWRMELQMSSGAAQRVSHWAYMAQCKEGGECMHELPGVRCSLPEFLGECGSPRTGSEGKPSAANSNVESPGA
ncbi:MAG TPA: hypothetical protein VJX67_06650, partial [Blastocatellia bacterium]|nr:hypothetical protein [Blastocatellia bacterium]